MFELPLFPLNTVLFPGMPLNLHIFEDRYKAMMNLCVEKHQPFGVVLIKSGTEAFGPLAEPHMIGCTAHITQVQPLSQGRMNIVAIGQDRFEIVSTNNDRPYLVGSVNLLPMNNDDPRLLTASGEKLRPWIERYLSMLARAGDIQFDAKQLPNEALALAYLGAVLVQVPPAQKQELLALNDAVMLMDRIRTLYRREVALLQAVLSKEPDETDTPGQFSLN